MPSNTFTVTASAPTVVSDTGPATVLNNGPGTVFYKADETVSATVYDGTIASGGSLTILSTTALITGAGSSASVSVTPLPWNPNLDTSGKLPVAQVPVSGVSVLPYSRAGTLAVQAGVLRFRFPAAATIDSVAATVGTAPTGASVIVDVLKNGTTIFTTQANRPTIAASANVSSDAVPDVQAVAAGDYLTINVAQVGSTAPGGDLVVMVKYH